MTDTALASIVVCSYNYGEFLRAAIDSALSQTYTRTEVIVVDDGSIDNSREIVADYGDRIVAVLKPRNEGHDAAINSGFAVSHGELVCFLDSDDVLFPTAVASALQCFRDPDVVKVHWPMCEIDHTGAQTGRVVPGSPLDEGDLREVVLRHGPQSYVSSPTSGNAWARRFLEQVCPIRELQQRAGTADDQLSMLAPLFGRVRRLEPQGFFRAHGRNSYWGKTLENLAATLHDYEQYCLMLSERFRALGIEANPDAWRKGSWFGRLRLGLQDIEASVPVDDTVVLVDDDKWGAGEIVAGRRRVPFPERDGQYGGRPADDVEAIAEVERLRLAGARYMVIGWPAFWWVDHYREWYRYLCSSARIVLKNERVIIVDLLRGTASTDRARASSQRGTRN